MNILDKYKNEIKTGFLQNKSILLESLIEYYGEEYREIITDRFNNTDFIFYIYEHFNKYLKATKTKSKTEKKELKILQKKLETIKNSIRKMHSGTINRIIYSSDENGKYSKEALETFNAIFYKNFVCMKAIFEDDKYKRFVFIPLFFSNDGCLIHEAIHSITSQLLGIADEKIIEKWGLVAPEDFYSDIFLEEATTEIETKKIYQIFKKNGGNFLDKCYPFDSYSSSYDFLLPFIENFYNSQRKDITSTRFSLNKNEILEICGREEYFNFSKTLNDFYAEFPNEKSEDFYSYSSLLESQYKQMNEHRTLQLKKQSR